MTYSVLPPPSPPQIPLQPDSGPLLRILFVIGKTLEIIGWVSIRVPLFAFRLARHFLYATLDAAFFVLFVVSKICQAIGREVFHLPFTVSLLVTRVVFLILSLPRQVFREFRPVISLMLGVPIVHEEEEKVREARARFARPSASSIFLLPNRAAWAFATEVDHYHAFRRDHPIAFSLSSGILIVIPLFVLFTYHSMIKELPFPSKLRTEKGALTTRIYDRNGVLLYKIYRNANRTQLSLAEIPVAMRQATIATEDHDFYTHPGISFRGIIRAAVANFSSSGGSFTQGGSTITQQLIKNTLLTPEKTFERKLKEIFLSVVAERMFTKDEIMEMYLNTVSYGGTAYGVEEASQLYFKKSARDLNLTEISLLAGLPSAPTTFSPHGAHPELARMRQREVLRNMIELGYITQEEGDKTLAQDLQITPPTVAIKAPHFVMHVKEYLTERIGAKKLEEGGLNVYTTLDWSLQQKAEEIVAEVNKELRSKYGANNAASVVTNPRTGEILAMVGSANYWDDSIKGNVNVSTSLRQPGSSIKVVNYAYALEHGGFTPSSLILDAPVVYKVAGSAAYAPVNYDGKFHGMVTVRKALANSYNIPAVKVLASYGPPKMIEMGKRMGITTWDNLKYYGLSITLGAAEVKMVDLAVVYGTLANMGVRKDLTPIKEITDANGRILVLEQQNRDSGVVANASEGIPTPSVSDGEAILSPSVAYWLTDILSDNKARLAAFGPYARLEIPGHKVAVKTGTSNDFKDNWTVGYTPDFLVATWVGNTDSKSMNKNLVSGITGAAPIWNGIMSHLLKDQPAEVYEKPTGLVPVKICASTGTLACANCRDIVTEYFIPGTEPKKACSIVSPDECAKKKSEAEAAGKKAEEIAAILGGCSLPTPGPTQ